MPVKFKLDNTMANIKKKMLKNAVWAVTETTNAVYIDAILFSPVKSWKYASWHNNKWVKVVWNKVIWEVENVGAYAERVEKWFKKNSVNWHLQNLWQIYTSKGANVYWKAIAKNKDIFLKKLRWQ